VEGVYTGHGRGEFLLPGLLDGRGDDKAAPIRGYFQWRCHGDVQQRENGFIYYQGRAIPVLG